MAFSDALDDVVGQVVATLPDGTVYRQVLLGNSAEGEEHDTPDGGKWVLVHEGVVNGAVVRNPFTVHWKGPLQPSGVQFKATRRISANVEQVFSAIAAVETVPQWNPLLLRVTPQKDNGRGPEGTATFQASVGGITVNGEHSVTVWQPAVPGAAAQQVAVYAANCQATSFGVTLAVNGQYSLTSINDHETEVSAVLTPRLPSILQPLANLSGVKSIFNNAIDQTLANLNSFVTQKAS